MDHLISADVSEKIKIQIKVMDWAAEITDLCHRNKSLHLALLGGTKQCKD